jgi:hypothetical protein
VPQVDAEFLQDLRAEHALPGRPQALDRMAGALVFYSRGAVMRVDQNIGVYEEFVGHRYRS